MELTSQVLREVEFSGSLRGYNTDEVDEFLEKIAAAAEALRAELAAATERLERAERVTHDRSGIDDEESIRRTLILAQRTADLAIKEAQEEAASMLDKARADAESIVTDARATADRMSSEAERALRDEVSRMKKQRDDLHTEMDALIGLLGAERERLTESLSTTLRFVERNLSPSSEIMTFATTGELPELSLSQADREVASTDVEEEESEIDGAEGADASAEVEADGTGERDEMDELEAGIAADAAAAAPGPARSSSRPGDLDDEWETSARPSLKALPSLDDRGDEATEAWDLGEHGHAGTPAS
ncbi:MAG: DivIVA domain-containing protein [Acidimicrobiales bacterium]